MTKIFISYRRSDSSGFAGRLYDRLSAVFTADNIFLDTETIPVGTPFPDRIREFITKKCTVFLALLSQDTMSRINDSDDWVRLEVALALNQPRCKVLPILVNDFKMPSSESLPDDIKTIATLNAGYLLHHQFEDSCNHIIRAITTLDSGGETHTNELLDFIERLHRNKQYSEVVQFGSALTRPLWVTGRYLERIQIGELVEDAAGNLNQIDAQVVALVDDLGWTNAILGNFDDAIRNIDYGIQLAERDAMYYWLAKGKRHIAGIEYRKRNASSALTYIQQALDVAEKIPETPDRNEMLAGIHRTAALIYEMQNDLEKAFETTNKARVLYEGLLHQDSRVARLETQEGYILLGLNRLHLAREAFRNGLARAQKIARKDVIAIASQGIGETYCAEKKLDKAIPILQEAVAIFRSLGMNIEASKVQRIIDSRGADIPKRSFTVE